MTSTCPITSFRRRLEAERRKMVLALLDRDGPMRRHELADLQGCIAAVVAVEIEIADGLVQAHTRGEAE